MKKEKDIKKVWYDKGWDACVKEFEWRIEETSEKFRKDGWHITDIDKCRKFISDLEEIISKLRK